MYEKRSSAVFYTAEDRHYWKEGKRSSFSESAGKPVLNLLSENGVKMCTVCNIVSKVRKSIMEFIASSVLLSLLTARI